MEENEGLEAGVKEPPTGILVLGHFLLGLRRSCVAPLKVEPTLAR
jgi:hypothetical protein